MQLAPTVRFQWGLGGALVYDWNPANPDAVTHPISTAGADQIGLFVSSSSGSHAPSMKIEWAGLSGIDDPGEFSLEAVEVADATSPGLQLFVVRAKLYKFDPGQRVVLWIPTAAHFFRLTCVSFAPPPLSSEEWMRVDVQRACTKAAFSQGL